MATRQVVEFIDDLDQTLIEDGGGTHTFSLNGRAYEIDLSDKNADLLREALTPFIDAARRVGRSAARPVSSSRARSRTETDAIREWARQNGYEVNDRGRIAETIIQAYRSA